MLIFKCMVNKLILSVNSVWNNTDTINTIKYHQVSQSIVKELIKNTFIWINNTWFYQVIVRVLVQCSWSPPGSASVISFPPVFYRTCSHLLTCGWAVFWKIIIYVGEVTNLIVWSFDSCRNTWKFTALRTNLIHRHLSFQSQTYSLQSNGFSVKFMFVWVCVFFLFHVKQF